MKSFSLAIIVTLLAVSLTVVSGYRRSCSAAYIVGCRGLQLSSTRTQIYRFKSSASSSGYIPNTLRKRAYRKARSCLNADARNVDAIPSECRNGAISNFGGAPFHTIRDILNHFCTNGMGRMPQEGTTYLFSFHGYVYGNRGCGGTTTRKATSWHVRNYNVRCRNGRARLVRGRALRGGDLPEGRNLNSTEIEDADRDYEGEMEEVDFFEDEMEGFYDEYDDDDEAYEDEYGDYDLGDFDD